MQLKKKIIYDYIQEHSRAPTEEEIALLLRDAAKDYNDLDNTGLLFKDFNLISFKDIGDSEKENQNRWNALSDINTVANKLESLSEHFDSNFSLSLDTLDKAIAKLKAEEARVNNLLFYFSNNDSFLFSITEDFKSLSRLDTKNTTLRIAKNLVSLDTTSYETILPTKYKLSMVNTNSGMIANTQGLLSNITRHVDYEFQYTLLSSTVRKTTVDLEVSFIKPTNLKFISFDLILNDGKESFITPSYSLDGINFTKLSTATAQKNNLFFFNANNIKTIRFTMSKESFDAINERMYSYNFILKNFNCVDSSLRYDTGSLICGPYYFYNRNGDTVLFNKAKLNACVVLPNDTSLSFQISADKENWYNINYKDDFANTIIFNSQSLYSLTSLVDETYNSYKLLSSELDHVKYNEEALVNFTLNSELLSSLILTKMLCFRSFVEDTELTTGNGINGWTIDKEKGTASCVFVLDIPLSLDLGPRGAILNGNSKTGIVNLTSGIHTFTTSLENWTSLETGISNEKDFIKKDSLYPYNHRYIIQGYNYSSGFKGEKKYIGIDKYYGAQLRYVSPEFFASLNKNNPIYYHCFTHFIYNGRLYFKVKVNKSSAYWQNDNILFEANVSNGQYDSLYVKLLLETSSDISPIIQSFSLRVE